MTKIILLIWAAVFLLTIAIPMPIVRLFAFRPGAIPHTLTGLVTYPLLILGPGEIINLVICGFMLWQFGGSLERGWGARTYLLFLVAANAAAAVLWTLGMLLFGHVAMLAGPWLMISSVIVAWAWINPEETIMFWFVLPLKAKWIGWLDIVLLYFLFPSSQGVGGWPVFVLGFFALGGVAVALGYDWYRRKWGWIPRRRRQPSARKVLRHPASTTFGAALRPFREWQRRRRIAKLQRTFRFDDEEQGRRDRG